MTTLREIAQEAGVSVTTVSNVINGNTGRVSPSTLARIQEIIRRHGYVPNRAARSLVQRQTQIVAVIAQAEPGVNILRDPYTAAYIGALTVALQRSGYQPLIRFTDDYRDVEANLWGWNVAGAIFCGAFSRNLQRLESLSAIPTVFTDCYARLPGVSSVGVDDESGGQMAADYLIQMGHRRLAIVCSNAQESDVDQHRLSGFCKGLTMHGLALSPDCLIESPIRPEDPQRLHRLLCSSSAPTAFFCTSDRIAAWLMQTLDRLHRRVPEDFSIMGFDDLPLAQLLRPSLTTLRQDIEQKASLAVDILLRHIHNRDLPAEHTLLSVQLTERKSVRRLSADSSFEQAVREPLQ